MSAKEDNRASAIVDDSSILSAQDSVNMLKHRFQCFLCSSVFPTSDDLAEHVEGHDIPKMFRCGLCEESFHENATMLSHISEAHGGLPVLYNCSVCKVAFQVLLSLEDHAGRCEAMIGSEPYQEIHSEGREDVCSVIKHENDNCADIDSDDLRRLSQQHVMRKDPMQLSPNKRKCKRKQRIEKGENLKQLILSDKVEKVSDVAVLSNVGAHGNLYDCKICTASFSSSVMLTLHMGDHDVEELYEVVCVKCDTSFRDQESLEEHVNGDECSGFKCIECGKSFGLESTFIRHTVSDHKGDNEPELNCKECNKSFTSRRAWARHKATHAKSLPYVCKICGKYFRFARYLREYHLSTAHKIGVLNNDAIDVSWYDSRDSTNMEGSLSEKKFRNTKKQICKVKLSFASKPKQKQKPSVPVAKKDRSQIAKSSANQNQLDNNTENHKCTMCVQVFKTSEELSVHMDIHALEECYSIRCMKCNVYFDNAESLEKHLEESTCPGFECSECPQKFGVEALLLKHTVIAHRQRSNGDMECSECHKKCPSRYAWARHEATHAKSEPYMCKLCGKHLSSLEHVLRYHLPTAHKLGKSTKKKSKLLGDSASDVSLEESNNTNSMDSTKVSSNTKPMTASKPKKLKTEQASSHSDTKTNEDQSKAETLEKHLVCIDCDICGGKVPNQEMLISHRAFHFMKGKISIKCSACPETFSQLKELVAHMREKFCSKYRCDKCEHIFPTELEYLIHNNRDHAERLDSGLYQCTKCPKAFDDSSSYVDHASEHVTAKQIFCKICHSDFASIDSLEVHLKDIHTLYKDDTVNNEYKCAQCLESFRTNIAIKVHRRFHMQREILMENKDEGTKPESSFASYMSPHFCNICSVGFGGAIHLERHKQIHNMVTDKPKCPICGQMFQHNGYLKVHMGHHNRPYLCPDCGKTFSSSQTLKNHSMAFHSALNPFQCQVCHKFYSSRGALHHHMKNHSGEKRFECKLCDKKFSDSTCLESHMLNHSAEKRFKCSVCSYKCRHRSVLSRHMDMHNGVKRYKCSYCGIHFRQHSSLKAHMTIHTGEKNFECEFCGKRFARRDYLNVHTLTHTKEKPLTCPVCNDRFAVTSNLNVHVRKVHGEKVYKDFQEKKARTSSRMHSASNISSESTPTSVEEMHSSPAPGPFISNISCPAPNSQPLHPPHIYPAQPTIYNADNSNIHPVYQPQQMFYHW